MDESLLRIQEREADEALYAVDPDFAEELGYTPPPPSHSYTISDDPLLIYNAESGRHLQSALAAQRQQNHYREQVLNGLQRNAPSAYGGMMGPGLGSILGGALGSWPFGRYG